MITYGNWRYSRYFSQYSRYFSLNSKQALFQIRVPTVTGTQTFDVVLMKNTFMDSQCTTALKVQTVQLRHLIVLQGLPTFRNFINILYINKFSVLGFKSGSACSGLQNGQLLAQTYSYNTYVHTYIGTKVHIYLHNITHTYARAHTHTHTQVLCSRTRF